MNKEINETIERLEKVIAKNKAKSQELKNLTIDIADYLCENLPTHLIGKELPRGYELIRKNSNIGSCVLLKTPDNYSRRFINISKSQYLHGDISCFVEAATNDERRKFAQAIQEGWLNQLADYIEANTELNEKAIKALESIQIYDQQ